MADAAIDQRKQFEREVVAAMPVLQKQLHALCKDGIRAEDLTQETVMRALAAYESFEPDSNLGAWLYTIGRNYFFGSIRKTKNEVEDTEDMIAETTAVQGSAAPALELKELAQAIDRLPHQMREPIRLVAVMGHTYEEASEQCGVPLGTIKSQINRARLLLGDYGDRIEPADEEEPRADEKEGRKFLYALAKHYLSECDGDIGAATKLLMERLASDKMALHEVATAALRMVAMQVSHEVVKNRRERIINRANAGRGAVIALAAGISAALLDMPLTGGAKLRQASRELVLEEAGRSNTLARTQIHRAKWLRLIAQCIPNGKCVGDVLDDKRAQELWDEAKK